jgi:hypothetical protein
MSGGISQLVAQGAQDVHLVGDPQVSFFRSTYKRHTNFSQVRQRQTIQGNPAANGMSSVRFERRGDLLSYTYLTGKNGAAAQQPDIIEDIDKVELYIGGQLIDSQDKDYIEQIWPKYQTPSLAKATNLVARDFCPLHFFFCDNWANSIPLVALQYHDVEIRIYWASTLNSATYECWSNFIYLDTAEREMFAQKPMDMLVTQVQKNNGSNKITQEFSFNHPVAFIASTTSDITATATDMITFSINGTVVGDPSQVSPHYSQVPVFYHTINGQNGPAGDDAFIIPFGLDLYRPQPSGSLNFSRLDSARLDSSGDVFTKNFYAVNYNILRIENGMGGLLYSN